MLLWRVWYHAQGGSTLPSVTVAGYFPLPLPCPPPPTHTHTNTIIAGIGPGFSGLAAGLLMAATSLRRVFLVGSLACAGLWAVTLGALWLATRGRRQDAAVARAQMAWTYEI